MIHLLRVEYNRTMIRFVTYRYRAHEKQMFRRQEEVIQVGVVNDVKTLK